MEIKRGSKYEKITMFERVIPFDHSLAPLFIRNSLFSLIPEGTEHICVFGIGSNLISGDSLGPFVGTLLNDLYPEHLSVFGTLQFPLDATTLVPMLSRITIPNNSFIIAIDSVLGTKNMVNTIVVHKGSLQPGAGLGHKLPSIGDCSVLGIVMENNPAKETSLLYTNLHNIYSMSTNIAKGISLAVRQYYRYPSNHPLLSQ